MIGFNARSSLLIAVALGIGAASFWSGGGFWKRGRILETGTDFGDGNEFWKRGSNGTEKDIAESPTASPERPKDVK